MLERDCHPHSAFVNLTYDDAHLPKLGPLYGAQSDWPTLIPKHLQDWLKRFRKVIEPSQIRYFACGEYGDETQRPHYHAAIFNFPTCLRGRTRRRPGSNRPIWKGCCSQCELVGETWALGDVDLGMLELHSAAYVCGYVTKKMTMRDDSRLLGREPEFARMSLKPGLGKGRLVEVAETLKRYSLDKTQDDVPSSLRHGSKEMPLGRYLTRELRKMVGRDEKAPQAVLDKIEADLQPLRQTAFNNSRSFASEVANANAPKVASWKARQQIFKGRKTL